MNKLKPEKRAQILQLMVEGCSIRSITRIAYVSKNTVSSLLVKAGHAFWEFQDMMLTNLPCKRIQVDEIWSFCYARQKNVETATNPPEGAGNVWTWVALCPDTKIIPCWLVGDRDAICAKIFIRDLSTRIADRFQLTSDGYKAYIEAVDRTFGNKIDYAMLIKKHDASIDSPFIAKRVMNGTPDPEHISTSLVERQNLTMRMCVRRLTRKTNAFSKKIENHCHALAIYFMHYNFVRIHQSLRVTPAMECGVVDKLLTIEDLVGILEDWEELN